MPNTACSTSCAYSKVLPGVHVLGEVEVAAVGREGRLAELLLELLARTLDQLHAFAAVEAVEPDLAGAERAARGEMLAGRDVAAVRMPRRIVEQAEVSPW